MGPGISGGLSRSPLDVACWHAFLVAPCGQAQVGSCPRTTNAARRRRALVLPTVQPYLGALSGALGHPPVLRATAIPRRELRDVDPPTGHAAHRDAVVRCTLCVKHHTAGPAPFHGFQLLPAADTL